MQHNTTGARVCHFKTPDLLDSNKASKDLRIQREVETLRRMNRVGSGSSVIARSRAFGGSGPANPTDSEPSGPTVSLVCLSIIDRARKERAGSVEV